MSPLIPRDEEKLRAASVFVGEKHTAFITHDSCTTQPPHLPNSRLRTDVHTRSLICPTWNRDALDFRPHSTTMLLECTGDTRFTILRGLARRFSASRTVSTPKGR